MATTGTGTTISFGTSVWVGSVLSIGGTTQSREALEDSHLGTSGEKTYVFDDLIEPGDFEIEFYWDQSAAIKPPISAVAETITVTFALLPTETTNATLTGTGGVIESTGPDTSNGELMVGSMSIQWDGKTGPTYTAGS